MYMSVNFVYIRDLDKVEVFCCIENLINIMFRNNNGFFVLSHLESPLVLVKF